jgi:hypothetical protein
MACTFMGVKGDFRTKRDPFVCPNHMQSSRRNPTYHFTPYSSPTTSVMTACSVATLQIAHWLTAALLYLS